MLEIAADCWPFSDQFQHLADQNPFSMGQQSKASDLKKMANQFLILIGLELHACCMCYCYGLRYSSSDRLQLLNKAVG